MPRRKKAPPQDMDVDSDEDNTISKQKKATEKFMALLKPIKDAALAFDVDVDEALEDYVEACVRYVEKDAGAMINFAEAGLLLQGSAVVYGRKVDGVHALVYRVLELLRTGQKEKEKAEKKAAVRSRRPAVLRRLHAIDATRVHLTMKWVVSFAILRPFGPRRDRDAPRRKVPTKRRSPRTKNRWTRCRRTRYNH